MKKEKLTITYHYRGMIERGNGKPGYTWHEGWSENSESGHPLYGWMTKRECQKEARDQGAKAVFVRNIQGKEVRD